MDSNRWEKLEALVEQALDLPGEEREQFLTEACGTDTEMRSEIESLLSCSDKALRFTRNFPENFILPIYFELGAQQEQAGSHGQPSLINMVITHYHVLEKIGSGGMGVVYKARDLRLDRYVAIKLLPNHLNSDSSAKTQFISEAKAVSALDHPNICTLHDISETDADHLYMTMAWYEGETLRQKLKKGAIDPRQAIDYAIQTADGLADAHQAGITHRDIKPSNIMITVEGLVKILDFGIAKTLQSEGLGENSVMGSPAYMSPEQVRGQQIDHRSDIWSLGVVLYEMLAGDRPFRGQTDAEMLQALLKDGPASIDGLPEELARIVMKCLEKDPAERYQHIGELREELIDFQNSLASSEENGSVAQAIFSKPVLAGGFLLALFMLAALVWHSIQTPVVDAQPSIAVLPLENLSPDPEDAYFADGVHEDIIIQLSQIGNIRPIARSSVIGFGSDDRDIQQISEELNVGWVLEGNVRRAGDLIRVNVQLVDPENHETVWADSYERDNLIAFYDIQRSIALEIASALQVTLTPDEQERIEVRPTEVAEAYEFYLLAREYFLRIEYLEEDLRRSEILLKQAIEFDPEFVQAYALLSRTYSKRNRLVGYDISPQTLKESKKYAEKALQLHSESVEAHLAMGYYYYFGHQDYHLALEHFTIARQAQPNNAEILAAIGYVQRWLGNNNESIQRFTEAVSLDPLNPDLRFDIAVTNILLRNYETANTEFETALAISPHFHIAEYYHSFNRILWLNETQTASVFLQNHEHFRYEHPIFYLMLQFMIRDFEGMIQTGQEVPGGVHRTYLFMYPVSFFLGLAYDYLGESEKAHHSFESALLDMKNLPSHWHDDPGYRMGLGKLYAVMGMEERAVEEGKKIAALLTPQQNHIFVWNKWYKEYLVFIYSRLEKTDESLELLRRLLVEQNGYFSVNRLRADPILDPIRDTPEFQKLLEEFGETL